MELKCPQCQKVVRLSAEELSLHGGQVVCPQCLTVFDASGDIPQGTVASRGVRVVAEHLTYSYCPHCGSKIPEGVNYCPYCGKSLVEQSVSPAGGSTTSSHGSGDSPRDTSPSKHHEDDSRTTSRGTSASGRSHSSGSSSGRRQGRGRQPVLPNYGYGRMAGSRRAGSQPASVAFALVAWTVIAALLLLLAYIIYKVNRLA